MNNSNFFFSFFFFFFGGVKKLDDKTKWFSLSSLWLLCGSHVAIGNDISFGEVAT